MGKKKTSGYATFADQEKKGFKEYERGLTFSRLLQVAKPYWEALTPEERDYWHDEAKSLNGQPLTDGVPKMATSCHRLDVEGPILSEYSKSPLPQLNSLESLLEGDIRQLNVVVVDTILFVDYCDGDVLPAEFGFVKGCLLEGVTEENYFIVDPRKKIKPGFYGKAKEGMERDHRIPYDGEELDGIVMTVDFKKKGAELKSMLADSPIVLCRKELLDQVNLSLIWLCNQTDLADFQVYSVEEFVHNASLKQYTVTQLTERLTRGDYDHESSIRCHFHANEDTKYCARKDAHKYFYLMAEILHDQYEFKIVEGKHKPEKSQKLAGVANMARAIRSQPFFDTVEQQSAIEGIRECDVQYDEKEKEMAEIPRPPLFLSKLKARGGGACGGEKAGARGGACGGIPASFRGEEEIPIARRLYSNRGGKKGSPGRDSSLFQTRDASPGSTLTTPTTPTSSSPNRRTTSPDVFEDTPSLIPRLPKSHSNKKKEASCSPPMESVQSYQTEPTICPIPRKPRAPEKSKEGKVANLEEYTYDLPQSVSVPPPPPELPVHTHSLAAQDGQLFNDGPQIGLMRPPPGITDFPPGFSPPGLSQGPPPGFSPPGLTEGPPPGFSTSRRGRRGRSKERRGN